MNPQRGSSVRERPARSRLRRTHEEVERFGVPAMHVASKLAGGFRVDVFERAVGVEEKWQRLRKWRQKKLMERETPPQIFAEKNNAAPFRYTTA